MFCREAQRRWSDPDRSLAQRTLSPPVEEAILALAPPFRVVVVLSDLEGFSYKEIAEIVDCPIGTVMSRLFRARRALRKNLAEVAAAYGIGPGLEDPLESAA
jgi:RNA polymerase sigma-70 factor (ECF subfamily)